MRTSALPLAVFAAAFAFATPAVHAVDTTPAATDSALPDTSFRRLHSAEVVPLKARYAGQPLLVVNTASHCGYTGQFKALEAIHQRYQARGLKVLGFSSDDFNQEADDEAKAADVCFVNFGVSFDMFAPTHVRGGQANPLFRQLARESVEPKWNFTKYVVGRDGKLLASFPSKISPDAPEVTAAIERAIAGAP